MSDESVRRLSLTIQQAVCALDCFRQAQSVALYHPFRGEVETFEILANAQSLGKEVYYPRHGEVEESFVKVGIPPLFREGRGGFLEPEGNEAVVPSALDCIVIPGIAFDQEGHRLGYGKGYYDRCLNHYKGGKIGIAYDFQILPQVPREGHDVRCDWVVSESRVLGRRS